MKSGGCRFESCQLSHKKAVTQLVECLTSGLFKLLTGYSSAWPERPPWEGKVKGSNPFILT